MPAGRHLRETLASLLRGSPRPPTSEDPGPHPWLWLTGESLGPPADPEEEEAAWALRERALRLAHARGFPLLVHGRWTPDLAPELLLAVPREAEAWVTSTLQPAYLPVRLRTTTEPRGPKAEGPSRSGILALPAGTGPGHPFPSVRLHKGPGPWTDLDRLWRGASVSVEALWFAHPVGPSRSRALPPLGPHPRNDHETPLPVAAPYAWRRDLEAVRAERALGPFWEVTALVTVSAGSRDLLPPRILAEVRSWWEAVTDLPGGGGLTLRWPLALDPQKAREALLRGRPLRQWVGSSPLVTAPELALWLPEPGPPFVRQHPAPSPSELSLLLPGGHALAPSWWVLDRKEGHHSLILGETGMGKSTLLASLALAVARPDVTVVVIDPLGPLVRGLLARLAPGPRSRVRILAPLSAPAALDPLASPAGEGDARRQRRVSEIITVLRQVRSERYGDTLFWGPRIEGLLHKVLGLLAETPGATLGEGELLLSSPERWPPARGALSLPQRERYNELVREPEENRQGVLRLLQEITHSPPLAAMLSGPGPGQLPRLVRPGSILLCDLERPAVGERVSSYLGGVLLSLLWSHLVERVETTPVVLILDEIQGYPTAALTEMLSQGRHFHLHVVAATQSLGALGPELRQALLSNARDWFLFRGTPGDLRWLEETVPGSGKVVLHLPRGEARGFLGKGERIVPVHVAPPSPLPPEQVTRAWQEALDRSRREAGPSSQRGATSEVSSTPPPLPTDLTATFARELTHWMRCRPGPPYLLPLQEVLRWVHGDERSLRRLGSLGRRTGLVVARRDLPSGPAWEIRPPAPEGPGDPGRPLTGVRQL